MKSLELTLDTPAENLACDEALLDLCEEQRVEILRFWESRQHFVVVGYGNRIQSEVNLEACRERCIPILRRCTGGGAVLQGPGCLNYALTLRLPESGPLTSVIGTNQFIMERNRAALEELLGVAVTVQGHTDLALPGRAVRPAGAARAPDHSPHRNRSGRPEPGVYGEGPSSPAPWLKFSGNAQRRKRASILFHGTFLYDCDLPLIQEFLRMPSKHPDYRSGRTHLDFLTNLQASAPSIQQVLRVAWSGLDLLDGVPRQAIAALVQAKYGNADWIERG